VDVVDETQDVVDVLDPVDGLPGVPKLCAQVRILAGARLRRSERRGCDARRELRAPSLLSSVSLPRVVHYVHHEHLTRSLGQ